MVQLPERRGAPNFNPALPVPQHRVQLDRDRERRLAKGVNHQDKRKRKKEKKEKKGKKHKKGKTEKRAKK
jgi:hypothetical protein